MKVYVDAYLEKNLGDDIFLDILIKRYPQHKFYAMSRKEKGYNSNNLKVFTNEYMYRGLKKLQLEKYLANFFQLVVTIGGSMYMESNNNTRDFSLGKNKRYVLGINFGPYQTQTYYDNIHNMLGNVEDVCFREKYSYNLFKDLPNARCASDIVFCMPTDDIKITNRKRVIISVISCSFKLGDNYTKAYEEKMIELIKFFMDKDYEVCLMSFCEKEGDKKAIESIIEKCDESIKDKIQTYYYNGNIKEALDVIGDSQIVVGSRFHANIIGLILGKAIIPVLYSDKTKNVLDDMNIDPKIIDIRNIEKFDINTISDEDLNKHFDISLQKIDAERHFEKLDKELGKKQ